VQWPQNTGPATRQLKHLKGSKIRLLLRSFQSAHQKKNTTSGASFCCLLEHARSMADNHSWMLPFLNGRTAGWTLKFCAILSQTASAKLHDVRRWTEGLPSGHWSSVQSCPRQLRQNYMTWGGREEVNGRTAEWTLKFCAILSQTASAKLHDVRRCSFISSSLIIS
jgi:hypothetical protein